MCVLTQSQNFSQFFFQSVQLLNDFRFKNQHRNGPSGPQNEGLPPSADVPYRKDKPQYVTIQRSR